jgi:hypothetical protein
VWAAGPRPVAVIASTNPLSSRPVPEPAPTPADAGPHRDRAPSAPSAPSPPTAPDPADRAARAAAVAWLREALEGLRDDVAALSDVLARQQATIGALGQEATRQGAVLGDLVHALAGQQALIASLSDAVRSTDRQAEAPARSANLVDEALHRTIRSAVLTALRTERELVVGPLKDAIDQLRASLDKELARNAVLGERVQELARTVESGAAHTEPSPSLPAAAPPPSSSRSSTPPSPRPWPEPRSEPRAEPRPRPAINW